MTIFEAIRDNDLAEARALSSDHDKVETRLVNLASWVYGNYSSYSDDKLSPLHLAALKGYTEIAKMLIEAGSDLEAKSEQGRTPLLIAAIVGHEDTLKLLLESGAKIEATAAKMTALHYAAREGNFKVVKALLEAGSNIDAKAERGAPIHYALLDIDPEILRTSYHEAPWSDRMAQVIAGDSDAHKHIFGAIQSALLLHQAGADTSLKIANGCTLDHVIASLGDPILCSLIKEWDKPSDTGQSPFHEACRSKRLEPIIEALSRGVDCNHADEFGMTGLHFMADQGAPSKAFELMLEHGADPLAKTKDGGPYEAGMTPIDIARHWDDDKAVEIMSNH